jgi:hypothetical protein
MPTCEVCPNNAYYGHETPQFCRAHQKAGMRNVVAQLCAHEGCTSTSRAFGYPGQKGTHCKKHAPFGMVNVANPVCEHPDCTSTSRVFDFPGGEGRFCKAHALSSMVNVSSARCEYAGCTVASRNFDVPGGKGRFCQHHREKGMVDVRNHPTASTMDARREQAIRSKGSRRGFVRLTRSRECAGATRALPKTARSMQVTTSQEKPLQSTVPPTNWME